MLPLSHRKKENGLIERREGERNPSNQQGMFQRDGLSVSFTPRLSAPLLQERSGAEL